MNRYHVKCYIPEADKKRLEIFTSQLNILKWTYTDHCIDNLKYRTIKLEDILLYIKDLKLRHEDIFEYYTNESGYIIKLCYRIPYTENTDLILVIGSDKNIITIYINEKNDTHITLNKNLYVRNSKI